MEKNVKNQYIGKGAVADLKHILNDGTIAISQMPSEALGHTHRYLTSGVTVEYGKRECFFITQRQDQSYEGYLCEGPRGSPGPALQASCTTGTATSITDSSPKFISLSRLFAVPNVPNRENLVGDFGPLAYFDDMIAENEASRSSPVEESHAAYANVQVRAGVDALLGPPTDVFIKFLATFYMSSYLPRLLRQGSIDKRIVRSESVV